MNLEGKISNPISIMVGNNVNVLLSDGKNYDELSLIPGVMFGGEHYGFVLISNYNGRQRESIYPTQCTIQGVGIEGNKLKVFEDKKRNPWLFDKSGRIEHSAVDEFSDEILTKEDIFVRNADTFLDKPLLLNPVRISISLENPCKSVILRDNANDPDYPLYPGAMLGGFHYGFILMIKSSDGTKEVAYPTQDRIDAVGIEGGYFGDLKVFVEGRYHPWVFTFDGKLKSIYSFNEYSRRDKEYARKNFYLDRDEDCFQFQKKKDK